MAGASGLTKSALQKLLTQLEAIEDGAGGTKGDLWANLRKRKGADLRALREVART